MFSVVTWLVGACTLRPRQPWAIWQTYTPEIGHPCQLTSILSPEATILLVCARNRDIWARLKAHKKTAKSHWLLKLVHLKPQSLTHTQNQTGTRNSWVRFLICPEPLRFLTTGQTQALGMRFLTYPCYGQLTAVKTMYLLANIT